MANTSGLTITDTLSADSSDTSRLSRRAFRSCVRFPPCPQRALDTFAPALRMLCRQKNSSSIVVLKGQIHVICSTKHKFTLKPNLMLEYLKKSIVHEILPNFTEEFVN